MAFYAFDFTCGNFTKGTGHMMGRTSSPKDFVLSNLEKNGEKNCNVVFKTKTAHHQYSPSSTIVSDETMPDFSYQVSDRWHTTLMGVAVSVVPVVLPMVLGSQQNKQ